MVHGSMCYYFLVQFSTIAAEVVVYFRVTYVYIYHIYNLLFIF